MTRTPVKFKGFINSNNKDGAVGDRDSQTERITQRRFEEERRGK